jgi:predicted transposase/invertase (TIGR01784 family)
MPEFRAKYVEPLTDFGFKRLFGQELSKDLLKDFLNELLKDVEGEIKEITFLNNEQLGRTEDERKAIYDIYCTNEKGEHFIVEIQKTKFLNFKERMIYYSTFPIQRQAEKGFHWDFTLKAVYAVGILDFTFNDSDPDKYVSYIRLADVETHKEFYSKLTYVFIEIPKFKKTIDELETGFEKWIYLIQNVSRLDRAPEKFKEKLYLKFFELAEIAKFTVSEYEVYQSNLKVYMDLYAAFNFFTTEGKNKGRREGLEEGLKEGMEKGLEIGIEQGIEKGIEIGIEQGANAEKRKMVINAKRLGLDSKSISDLTSLSESEIQKILNEAEL